MLVKMLWEDNMNIIVYPKDKSFRDCMVLFYFQNKGSL